MHRVVEIGIAGHLHQVAVAQQGRLAGDQNQTCPEEQQRCDAGKQDRHIVDPDPHSLLADHLRRRSIAAAETDVGRLGTPCRQTALQPVGEGLACRRLFRF